MSTFPATIEQQGVYDWLKKGRGHGAVSAVAGGGKTTVLVNLANLIKTQGIFIAFNKHVVEQLTKRFVGTNVTARTINSIGHGALIKQLGKVVVKDKKYRELAESWMGYHGYRIDLPEEEAAEAVSVLVKLCSLARLTLTDPSSRDALIGMCVRFGIPFVHPALLDATATLLAQGEALAKSGGVVDYDDQLYLPVKWNLPLWGYPFVFVDEAQDLSTCARKLVYKLVGAGGRLVAVGDERQSIMAFAGADADSFPAIIREMNATVLPLSVCFRCPTSHLDFARRIVPHIQPRPDAPKGDITYIEADDVAKHIELGDLVVCRQTHPVVALCIKLIAQRIPARVRGRDIGRDLMSVVNRVRKMRGWKYAKFTEFLERWKNQQVEKLRQKDADESQIESLTDKVVCVQTCVAAFTEAHDLVTFEAELNKLFSDDVAGVWLSTIHRAKGLEADRVFILRPEKLPLRWRKQTPEQFTQEMNLKYVALTRAKVALFVVGKPEDLFRPEGDFWESWDDEDDILLPLFEQPVTAPPVAPTKPKPRNMPLEIAEKAVNATTVQAMTRYGRELANLLPNRRRDDVYNAVNDFAASWLIVDAGYPKEKKIEQERFRTYLRNLMNSLPRD